MLAQIFRRIMLRHLRAVLTLVGVAVSAAPGFAVQPASLTPNADPVYQQVRKPAIGEAFTVNNVVLKRDVGTFTFASGTLCFVKPINGKITGAVFSGDGSFSITPPTMSERKSLSYLTKSQTMDEQFHELGLRFGDDTYETLKKTSGVAPANAMCPGGVLDEMLNVQKTKIHTNLAGRLLEDVLNPGEKGLFVAFIKGTKYNGKLIYAVDPHGAHEFGLAPEEVALLTYDDNKWGVWSSFHQESEYKDGALRRASHEGWFRITDQVLNVAFEKSGKMTATTATTVISQVDGLRVISLDLYPTLRVSAVALADGTPINWVQEDKNDDPDFSVILPKALARNENATIKISYSGKEAVQNEGSGNYYVSSGARESWYPNSSWEDHANFTMRFSYPKDMTLVATGKMVSEKQENGMNVSEWKSEQPLTVACFQFGKFKRAEKTIKIPGDFTVETYANLEIPDVIRDLQDALDPDLSRDVTGERPMAQVAFGNFNTTKMMEKAMAEAELAVPLYTSYFGPTPFSRIAITQQTAMNYGQSFPGLVWLPMSSFFDSTVRHQLNMDYPKGAYFTVVAPHEIAHQWWGHTVTWASYRDQWMSEGFADFSASLFLQAIDKSNHQFIKFWNDERDMLTDRNKEGFRAIDVGPLTMGYRLNTSKTGSVTRRLIYPKGAYVLHMIRMMMFSSRDGDARFKAMMHDFVKTYYNKAASTEDFKAMVEKYMTPDMDVTNDHKMDWFFDPYVYGTTLPNYKFSYNLTSGANGPVLDLNIAQSNVPDNFKMIVPVYIELNNGRVLRLGTSLVEGNSTKSEHVDLGAMGLKENPKKISINYYDDVLSTGN
jgi:hypothetical protein